MYMWLAAGANRISQGYLHSRPVFGESVEPSNYKRSSNDTTVTYIIIKQIPEEIRGITGGNFYVITYH